MTTYSEDDAAAAAAADRLATAERLAALPWWRRPRRIGRQLAVALVLSALLAVLTFGGLNFFAARDLLVTGTQDRLIAVGATRANAIDAGTARLVAEISVVSGDLALGSALAELSEAFAALNDEVLAPGQREALDEWYLDRVVLPVNEAGLGPYTVADLVPRTPAGQWLQYHYTVRPPDTPAPADAGDGTAYSAINARIEDKVRTFSESIGAGDILWIDQQGTIVYSLDKRNDVGTNLVAGPYAQSALAQVVTDRLPQARVGTTLLTDFTISPTGRPAMFAVSAIRSGAKVIGALAVEVPVAALNRVVSADGNWEAIGLEDGDAYIVASDLTLQSEPRAWLDDPQGYLERLRGGDEQDQAEADLIEFFGTPVGIQVIDTEPVSVAADGGQFSGNARGITGSQVFAAAESFDASGQQWLVVTEVPRSAVFQPLTRYLLRILIVLAIVLPIVAGIGIWLSRLLTKPIPPTVRAAEAIVAGDRQPDLDTSRPDEFGDLARRFTAMADSLAAREAELAAEYERKRQLLLAVLPAQLVDEDGNIAGTGESSRLATVVAVTVRPADDHVDDHTSDALARAAQLAEQVAAQTGLERVRVAADRYLFLAGVQESHAGADAALAFAAQFRRELDGEVDVPLALHIGLSSGAVATGVLDSGSLTFGAWGEPVRRALAIAALSKVDEVLVDASTAAQREQRRWPLEPAHDVVDLDGEPMELFTLVTADAQP